jgi:hypothetical protein
LNLFPDTEEEGDDKFNTIQNLLSVLEGNAKEIYESREEKPTSVENFRKRLEEKGAFKKLLDLFEKYKDLFIKLQILAIIARLHSTKAFPVEMETLTTFVKDQMTSRYFNENITVFSDVDTYIFGFVNASCFVNINCRKLIDLNFGEILVQLLNSEQNVLLIASIWAFQRLSCNFNGKEADEMVCIGIWFIFEELLAKLGMGKDVFPDISTIFLTIKNILSKNSGNVIDDFVETQSEIFGRINKVLIKSCNLMKDGITSEYAMEIFTQGYLIFRICGKSLKNIKKLFCYKVPNSLFEMMNTFLLKWELGGKGFDICMEDIMILLDNWSAEGFANKNDSKENELLNEFKSLELPEKLLNIFNRLVDFSSPSDSIFVYLNHLCLCLCHLLCGQTPPSNYRKILNRCKYLMNISDDDDDLLDDIVCKISAREVWDNMVKPDEMLEKWNSSG